MAIAYQTPGAFAYDDTFSPASFAFPAGIVTGNKLLLIVGQKPSFAGGGAVTTPSGWTLVASLAGGGGYGATLGADTGNTNLYLYERTADGTETGSLSVVHGSTNVLWGQILRFSSGTGFWDSVTATTGSDAVAGNVSIAGATNPGFTTGDMAVWAMCIPTDVTTPAQFSAHAITAAGATFGAAVESGEADSTTGNDIGGYIAYATVTAGTSTGVPTFTATAGGTTTNVRGPGVIVRLREGVEPVAILTDQGASQSSPTDVRPRVTTNSPSGTLYMVCVPDGDTPSVAQIKAGQRSNSTAAINAQNLAISTSGVKNFATITGLTTATPYDFWFVHTTTAGDSIAVKADFTPLSQTSGSFSSFVNVNDGGAYSWNNLPSGPVARGGIASAAPASPGVFTTTQLLRSNSPIKWSSGVRISANVTGHFGAS
jgi:hypothetical protein